MIDMKKKAEDILEDYSNSYSQVDLETLAKFLCQIEAEAIKEYKERVEQELIAKGLYPVVVKNVLEETEKEMVGDRDEGKGTVDDSAADMRGVAYVDSYGEYDSVDRGGG